MTIRDECLSSVSPLGIVFPGRQRQNVGPGSALSTPTLPCRGQDVLHPGGPCGQRTLPSYGRLKGPREVGPRPLPLTLGGLRGEDRRTGKASESEGSHARTQPRTLPRSPSPAPSCEAEREAKKQSPRSPGVTCRLWVSVFMSQLPGEEGMGACGASTRLAPPRRPGAQGGPRQDQRPGAEEPVPGGCRGSGLQEGRGQEGDSDAGLAPTTRSARPRPRTVIYDLTEPPPAPRYGANVRPDRRQRGLAAQGGRRGARLWDRCPHQRVRRKRLQSLEGEPKGTCKAECDGLPEQRGRRGFLSA